MSHLSRVAALISVCLSACNLADAQVPHADILLQRATLYDGVSEEPAHGDVAIRNGRIVAIGKSLDLPAVWNLDCSGQIICTGFIDLHNHADRRIGKAATRANMN